MPGSPAFLCQKRVGKDGKLFTCHKFRSMTVKHSGSSVSVAGDSRMCLDMPTNCKGLTEMC